MDVNVATDKTTLAVVAANHAARSLKLVLDSAPMARLVAATGASQLDFLDALTRISGIDWRRVEMFHLDEYIGLPISHPASFRKYLQERLIQKVGIEKYHLLDGQADSNEVIQRVSDELLRKPIDIAFVGIGENGHLAFNDPPADFETESPYIIVELDEACRRQQASEGWFATASDVPAKAISMSIKQILESREIIAVVPDQRKAEAVKACLEGPISPMAPASILRTHPKTTIYLDWESASLLSETAMRSK